MIIRATRSVHIKFITMATFSGYTMIMRPRISKKTTFPRLSPAVGFERWGESATARSSAKTFSPALWMEPLGMADGVSYLGAQEKLRTDKQEMELRLAEGVGEAIAAGNPVGGGERGETHTKSRGSTWGTSI